MKTIIIGIAGGTGSGKTTLTEKLRDHFGANEVSVLNHDSYYKRHDELPYEERCKLNYDHPDSFDTPLMVAHLRELRAGHPVHTSPQILLICRFLLPGHTHFPYLPHFSALRPSYLSPRLSFLRINQTCLSSPFFCDVASRSVRRIHSPYS